MSKDSTTERHMNAVIKRRQEYEQAKEREHFKGLENGVGGSLIFGFPAAIGISGFFEGERAGTAACIAIAIIFAICYLYTRRTMAKGSLGSIYFKSKLYEAMDAKNEAYRRHQND